MVNRLRYLLDTDICVYIKRFNPLEVRQRLARQPTGTVAMSTITWGELMFGACQSRHPEQAMAAMQDLATHIQVLSLPRMAGEHYGLLHSHLVREGRLIGHNDLWIAAHALAEDLVLVTNNTREFSRVPDLRIENWVAPG